MSRRTPNSAQQLEESSMYPKTSRNERWLSDFNTRRMRTFHKHLNKKLLSAICLCVRPWSCFLTCNVHQDDLTRKKAGFPCSDLNDISSFISQDIGLSVSPVETLEKPLCPCLISTGGITSLWQLETHSEFNASKWDDTWVILKIDRNPNFPVASWTGPKV